MIRAVIDPGVLISAFIAQRGSAPDRIVRGWHAGAFELLVSPHLLAELAAVLKRPKFVSQAAEGRADAYVAAIAAGATVIEDPPGPPPTITPDPRDDYLFALARAAAVDAIVSGDRHLLGVPDAEPVVLTPRDFVDLIERNAAEPAG